MALRDGSTIHIRPVQAEDEEGMHVFLESLDPGSRMFRFFSGGTDLTAAAHLMVDVDYAQRYGLVAVRERATKWSLRGSTLESHQAKAEIAFAIAPGLQGLGLGTLLLAHLAEVAQENGISVFTAEVMPENHRMIEVFRESGFPVEMSSARRDPRRAADLVLRRGRRPLRGPRPARRARPRFAPSSSPGRSRSSAPHASAARVGGQLFHNVLESGFEGVVYPVNPSAEVVQSVRAYPSVTEVPGRGRPRRDRRPCCRRDRRCARVRGQGRPGARGDLRRIRRDRARGAERQDRLVEICREAGMRLVGPNCLGILNTAPSTRS